MQHKRKLINRFPDNKGIAYFEQCSFVFGKFFYFGVIFLGENPSLLVKEVISMKITINGTITALAAAVMLAGCGAEGVTMGNTRTLPSNQTKKISTTV